MILRLIKETRQNDEYQKEYWAAAVAAECVTTIRGEDCSESFAKKRFSDGQAFVEEITDEMDGAPAKEGALRYFVKEELFRERANLFFKNHGVF